MFDLVGLMGMALGRRMGARVSGSLTLAAVTTSVNLTFLACGFCVVGDSHMHLGELASCEVFLQRKQMYALRAVGLRVMLGSHLPLQPKSNHTGQPCALTWKVIFGNLILIGGGGDTCGFQSVLVNM